MDTDQTRPFVLKEAILKNKTNKLGIVHRLFSTWNEREKLKFLKRVGVWTTFFSRSKEL